MRLEDLKYGNVLETEYGKKFIKTFNQKTLFIRLNFISEFNVEYYGKIDLEENFIFKDKLCNIEKVVRIYEDYTCQKVLWERPKELSEAEKTLLKCLPKEINYITRDSHGDLWVFEKEPKKIENYYWDVNDCTSATFELILFNHLFESIKWEDHQATRIEDLLKEGD